MSSAQSTDLLVLREAVALVAAWLRDPENAPEELLARLRELASVATDEARAARRDPEQEGRRRGWWRVIFLLAEAQAALRRR